MKKIQRHQFLKKLIQEENIQKQEDIVRILKERNIQVTQATISRDIKELNLVKVPASLGGYKYSLPMEVNYDAAHKLERVMKDSFQSMDIQKEFLLIRTLPGNAMALGAVLEKMEFDEIFGIISGDDTVLIICKDDEKSVQLQNKLIRYM